MQVKAGITLVNSLEIGKNTAIIKRNATSAMKVSNIQPKQTGLNNQS